MSTAPRSGLLLINLGTPDAPTTAATRRYLREFLSDPLVIDLPAPARFALLNFIILPFRSPRSAAAYRSVWTAEGSPLMVNSRALEARVRERLSDHPVELAMRYGNPDFASALARLRSAGCDRLVALPLYPQRAASSTGSTEAALAATLQRLRWSPRLDIIPPFHADERFLDAWGAVASAALQAARPDRVLFSFHGLPERHIRHADASGSHCLTRADCCATLREVNRDCYRAQCFATAAGIARRLGLQDDAWEVAFQSRLGRTPWIQPFTDQVITRLAGSVRRLAVICPAFVADCLETVEEIGIRGAAAFRDAGGEQLTLVPSLNAHPAFVDAVVGMTHDRIAATPG